MKNCMFVSTSLERGALDFIRFSSEMTLEPPEAKHP